MGCVKAFNHYEDQSFSSAGAELPARRFGSDDEPRDPSAALWQALPELRRQTQPTGGGLQVRGHGPQRPRAQSARRTLRRQCWPGAQPPALLRTAHPFAPRQAAFGRAHAAHRTVVWLVRHDDRTDGPSRPLALRFGLGVPGDEHQWRLAYPVAAERR